MPGITPSEIIYQQQHIRDDRSSDVVGASITMAVLAAAAVTLRFLSRKQTKVAISHDDYFMLSALVGRSLLQSTSSSLFRS